MFNFFTSKTADKAPTNKPEKHKTDLELIYELEKQTGEEIPRIKIGGDLAEILKEIKTVQLKGHRIDKDKLNKLFNSLRKKKGIFFNTDHQVVYFKPAPNKRSKLLYKAAENKKYKSLLYKTIFQLKQLLILNLGGHSLSDLPAKIGQLQQLTILNLSNNKLSTLPPEISKLQQLTKLGLSNNQFSTLPPEIGKLQQLRSLNLSNNQLTHFPKVLLDLNLEIKWSRWSGEIAIEDNPFKTPPIEIVKQGRQAIINYFSALEKESGQLLNESKLILIGDGAAGKTSLMNCLLGLDFNPQESQTHGINIKTFNLKDKKNHKIKFHCWDFGGQQIMHATHQFFLSKRCLYLLVIDSRRESQVDYWLKHIQAFGHHAPVIIVINKVDENPHFNLPQQRQLKQKFPNLKYITPVSCATKQGINDLKAAIQNSLSDIELLNTPFPKKWFQVKEAIAKQAKQNNFTSYEHYIELCEAKGIYQESEQNTLINFLHDLGIIHHFQDPLLRETNVINPQWITEAVYAIINAKKLANNGKLHRNDLKEFLDKTLYPERKYDYILALMQKFELCYALDNDVYLLPDLFPMAEPEFEFDSQQALSFILEYDFLPKSIFTRFIIRLHRDIFNNTYWRNGLLLKEPSNNTHALVEVDTSRKQLILQVNGAQKREYLAVLLFILRDINRHFSQLNVTEKIALPDNPELSVNHDYLLKLAAKGQTEYLPPEDSNKSYKISELLGMVAAPSETESIQMLHKIIEILKAQGIEKEKDLLAHIDDVVKINPEMFGISIDVNALLKKIFKPRSS